MGEALTTDPELDEWRRLAVEGAVLCRQLRVVMVELRAELKRERLVTKEAQAIAGAAIDYAAQGADQLDPRRPTNPRRA